MGRRLMLLLSAGGMALALVGNRLAGTITGSVTGDRETKTFSLPIRK